MDPIAEANFDITEDDVIALHTRLMRKSPLIEQTRRKNWRTGIQAGLIVAASFAGVAYATAPTQKLGLLRAGGWTALYGVIWPMFAYRTLSRGAFDRKLVKTAASVVRERKIPFTLGPCRILLFPDQLMVVENDGSFAKLWSAVANVAEEADAVFVDCSDGTMLRIPVRAFENSGERSRFMQELKQLIALGVKG